MGWAWCKPEVALIGILRVVEELRTKKPGSHIVINGLLPRSFDVKKGMVQKSETRGWKRPALWKAIQDINHQLEEYSATRDNVEYFDVGDLFFKGECTLLRQFKKT